MINGDIGEEVYFRIRIRTASSGPYKIGVVRGMANWAIGVLITGLMIVLAFCICGFFVCRRYRSGQGFAFLPGSFGSFGRRQTPYTVTYASGQSTIINPNVGPTVYSQTGYPAYPPSNMPPTSTAYPYPQSYGPQVTATPHSAPPPPGFNVGQNDAPPPYSLEAAK